MSLNLSNKMKTELKKRLASATAILAVLVLVFACSNINLIKREIENNVANVENKNNSSNNEISVIKDSTGINLDITAVAESGVNTIEVYQGTNKIMDYSESGTETVETKNIAIQIPFGEIQTITVKVNGDTVAQKDIQNIRYIYNAQDLVAFKDIVNTGDTFEGKYVELMDNIDLSSICSAELGKSWEPIGEFRGDFNGNFFEVRNMYINAGYTGYIGFFRMVKQGGVIENLIFRNAYINNTRGVSAGGIVCGSVTSAKLINCGVISGSFTCYTSEDKIIGGVAGQVNGAGLLERCFNRANLGAGSGTQNYVGGIVGNLNQANSTLRNCYNTGNISCNTSYGTYLGGICATTWHALKEYHYLENCYNTGSIPSYGSNCASIMSGTNSHTVVKNSYYTSDKPGCTTIGWGNPTMTSVSQVSASALKGYANTLGSANWTTDVYGINNEFPIMHWQVPQLTLDKYQEYANIGDSISLTVSTSKMGTVTAGTITWKSDNSNVATVDNNGVVTAVGEGTATIYATESNYELKAMMIINVIKNGTVAMPQICYGDMNNSEVFSAVLKEDGTVWTSGDNKYGQLRRWYNCFK